MNDTYQKNELLKDEFNKLKTEANEFEVLNFKLSESENQKEILVNDIKSFNREFLEKYSELERL